MKKNVGDLDSFIRITLGLFGLAWGINRMIRHPYRTSPLLITFLGAKKVAEGITRWCPTMSLFGISTRKPQNEQEEHKDSYRIMAYANRSSLRSRHDE